ncbi:MAG: hypothetical protein QGG54_00695 [Gammaproteobacteria bacterium]|jgi:hypothetical protein|nr:hypothetical protein [Gammaproteobacteria bacterium]MDP6734370.1 hypothetical protein [Gammaproteobacteria bacterium]HAJ75439.1 hypothetical protein [Gammaproteobacteria bacterium]|tara:strand:- start:4758 stop:4946 length:189 start_codon:yes stop_codon:yes gene_type:complete
MKQFRFWSVFSLTILLLISNSLQAVELSRSILERLGMSSQRLATGPDDIAKLNSGIYQAIVY